MISKRNKARIAEMENEMVDNYFAGLIQRFQANLFTADWDGEHKNIDVFKLYDKAWRTYAEDWNTKRAKVVLLDPNVFSAFAINQKLTGDERESKEIGKSVFVG